MIYLRKWYLGKIFTLLYCIINLTFKQSIAQKVEIQYQNFRFVYHADDEPYMLRLLDELKVAVLDFEEEFQIHLNKIILIYLPSTKIEYRNLTLNKIPDWSSAVYLPEKRIMILKKPEWIMQEYQIEKTFLHELSHVYFHEKFKNNLPPLWFNEGMAEYCAGDEISLQDGIKLANAIFSKKIVSLSDVDSLLDFSTARAELAYLQSLSAIFYLKEILRKDSVNWHIFLNSIEKNNFETTLIQYTNFDLIDFEIAWFRWLKNKYKWFVIFNLENLIWIGIVMVLIGAMYAIRYRNQKRLIEMEIEEALENFDFKENDNIDETI